MFYNKNTLSKGDTIGLISPSSPIIPGCLESGISYFHDRGFKIKVGAHLHDVDRFLAGSDLDKAKDVMEFFKDEEVHAIIVTGGGQGSQRILPFLNYDIIQKNPKILVGFSDTTALSLGLNAKVNLPSYTGFTIKDTMGDGPDKLVEDTLWSCLFRKPFHISEGITINKGNIQGELIGGNLTLTTALMGTPFQPDFHNKILLIEEVWSEPYQIDGRLSQLHLAGIFKQVSGVIFGIFKNCEAKFYPETSGTVDDVINDWSVNIDVPCIKNFPYGHVDRRCVLPIGENIMLDATNCCVNVF